MKTYYKILGLLFVGGMIAVMPGCTKKDSVDESVAAVSTSTVSASDTVDISSEQTLQNKPAETYENVEQMGEGVASGELPDDTDITKVEWNEPLTFTQDGQELYTVTIHQAGLTDRRAVAETEEPEEVLLLNYSYISLTGEAVLVDDMSFRCTVGGGENCTPYYLANQIIPEVNQGGTATEAEVAFSIPQDIKEVIMYVTNNSNPDGETYEFNIQI